MERSSIPQHVFDTFKKHSAPVTEIVYQHTEGEPDQRAQIAQSKDSDNIYLVLVTPSPDNPCWAYLYLYFSPCGKAPGEGYLKSELDTKLLNSFCMICFNKEIVFSVFAKMIPLNTLGEKVLALITYTNTVSIQFPLGE